MSPTSPATVTAKLPSLETLARPPWDGTVASTHAPGATIASPAQAATRRIASDHALASGFTLGPELGRGGFGVVNLATQEVFGRRVAVKRLLSARGGDEARKFHAEAVVTANLQHPNVVPIHDLTRDGDQRLQLVMKCVEGLSWRDLLHPTKPAHQARAAALTRDDHLDILLKVCDAVGFAHGRGILHRDLKPENVMVGEFGEVQVMDWGCAVAFGPMPNHEAIPRVESIDHIAGTPAYMAPEMALAKADAIGERSDVYLLGAILYEVLTGTRPHRGDDVYALLANVVTGAIEPPQERAPERDIPDELAWIALAALAREPSERTASVTIFARQLKDFRAHAQAMRLAATAKAHLEAASAAPADAEHLLRKAVTAADNAVELWPERTAGLRVQLAATLASAEHAFATAAFATAQTLAERARDLAASASAQAEAKRASAIAAKARAAEKAQRTRQRQLRVTRIALAAAAVVVVAGLAAGIAVVAAEQRKTADALKQSQAAFASLREEQEQRRTDQHRAAPGLLAQARAAEAAKRYDESEQLATIARSFDPRLGPAPALLACLQAARGDYVDAKASAETWRALDGGADAAALGALCAQAEAARGELAPDITTGFGELFTRQGLHALADSRLLSADQRLAAYRRRIESAVPGCDAGLVKMTSTGNLTSGIWPSCFHSASSFTDLSALRGLRFEELNLYGTAVHDLAPLAGMPLRMLMLGNTKVGDVSALGSLPLEGLDLSATEVVDLAPLRSLPLRWLTLGSCRRIIDLGPLRGLHLEALGVDYSGVTDLAPLAGASLTSLTANGTTISDWSLLGGLPLRHLEVSRTGFDDTALARVRPQEIASLNVGYTRVTDLTLLRTMQQLTELTLVSCAVSDLKPLSGLPLQKLDCSSTQVSDVAPLADLPLVELGVGNTRVADLSPLRGMTKLRILAIDHTPATDLRPIASLPLERLMLGPFTKGRTYQGLDELRANRSLATIELWSSAQWKVLSWPAAEFWRRYDAGELAGIE